MIRNSIFTLSLLLTQTSLAQDIERAEFNYILFCQGCHSPDAMGSEGRIPRMNNYVGHFLKVNGGREYLVRVPGSANAAINDEQLAELLNWIVMNYSGSSLPEGFVPYTETEVGKLREKPLMEVVEHREQLVDKINALMLGE